MTGEDPILNGEFDGHAGNSEISNMIYIDEKLVKIPPKNYPKSIVGNPFESDNLIIGINYGKKLDSIRKKIR